jgi:hypothetical protein
MTTKSLSKNGSISRTFSPKTIEWAHGVSLAQESRRYGNISPEVFGAPLP